MADTPVNTDLSDCNYIVNTSTLPNYTFNNNVPGNVTISAVGTANTILSSNGSSGYNWSALNASTSLDVTGDAHFSGDIKWQGRSLGKLLETIESRLAILQEPNPEKLEKYAALKKAYEHYKTLERLIGEN